MEGLSYRGKMDEELRKQCLNKAIGKRNCLEMLKKDIEKELAEAKESIKIWKKNV